MVFGKEVFRKKLLKERSFLKRFVEASGSRSKIQHLLHISTHHQLVVLACIVHFVACGEVAIKRECLERLKRSKKAPILRRLFEHEREARELKSADRETLLGALSKITSVLPEIVGCLFEGKGGKT